MTEATPPPGPHHTLGRPQLVEVRTGSYRDSVALMELSQQIGDLAGVRTALVSMATELNLALLNDLGFDTPAGAGPNDLIIAVGADDEGALERARAAVDRALSAPPAAAASQPQGAPAPRTTAAAVRNEPATVAIVSVPGRYAFAEAMDALESGVSVMIFSDNMPVEQEIRLKDEAGRRGALVMGPDCGTAVIGGVGLGFANVLPRGPVGVVAASGTGAQQLTCLLAAAGVGVSHCLGVGGRDLSAPVGARSTMRALEMLDADPSTDIIVVIAKSPDPATAEQVAAATRRLSTPVVLGWGDRGGDGPAPETVKDLTAIVGDVLHAAGQPIPQWPRWDPDVAAPRRTGALRGLYSGGTLRDEAYALAGHRLGRIALDDLGSLGHLLIDFGRDRFTVGRPHPMIDPLLRMDRLRKDLADPATGVVLVDVVLGHGAHQDPASVIAEALADAADDVVPPVVAALVGTDADPQDLETQALVLTDAGARVFLSHAEAVTCALQLLSGGGDG